MLFSRIVHGLLGRFKHFHSSHNKDSKMDNDVSILECFNRATLCIQHQKVYDSILFHLRKWEHDVPLPNSISIKDLKTIIECIILDYPDIFHLGSTIRITLTGGNKVYHPEYVMDSSEYDRHLFDIEDICNHLISLAPDSDFDKELYVNDFLVKHVKYQRDGPYSVSTIVGAIKYGRANCSGISLAVNFILSKMGVPVATIPGLLGKELHAWNIVHLNGINYHLDVTNNRFGESLFYPLFNLSDSSAKKTLTWSHRTNCISEDMRYLGPLSIELFAIEELIDIVPGLIHNNITSIALLFRVSNCAISSNLLIELLSAEFMRYKVVNKFEIWSYDTQQFFQLVIQYASRYID